MNVSVFYFQLLKVYTEEIVRNFKDNKPEKKCLMRVVVSTLGSPLYGTSKYLVKIVQSILNKDKHKVLNSSRFVEEAKEWNISPNEIQTSLM